MSNKNITYRIGIDVGLNSTGLAAISVDSDGRPLEILNAVSVIHDGGVDPNKMKEARSRRLESGIARRTRRMRRRRRKRLQQLDELLVKHGYPLVDTNEIASGFEPWYARAELADGFISDDIERKKLLSIAIRHMARHRGWRNPYRNADYLRSVTISDLSKHYEELVESTEKVTGNEYEFGLTPAQLVCEALEANQGKAAMRLRTRTSTDSKGSIKGLLPTKLFQEDNAYELLRIFRTQNLSEDEWIPLFKAVFEAQSPKGSAEKLVGKDPLNPTQVRALKASLAFQKYRIMNILSNLRIKEDGEPERRLSVDERKKMFEILSESVTDEISWADVAEIMGLKRQQIRGIGSLTSDGEERVTSRPPILTTLQRIHAAKPKIRKPLEAWFGKNDEDSQESMIRLLSNTVDIDKIRDDEEYANALEWINNLADDALTELDKIDLPSGRAAYSVSTLRKLTERMLSTEEDLHEARKSVFGIDDNWRPPCDPIGAPLGNPAVDRVLKIVNRYLINARKRWGDPQTIQIEHVRNSMSSVATARKNKRDYEQMLGKRTEYRDSLKVKLREQEKLEGSIREYDLRRIEAIERQNGECLYCGQTIEFSVCEIDHIVPRKGVGATNTRTNLAAVCIDCNKMKSNIPFARWCKEKAAKDRGVSLKDALDRVDHFLFAGNSYTPAQQRHFKQEVKLRLSQTEDDPEIDNRSIESVAWMADELHRRIDWYFNHSKYSNSSSEDTPQGKCDTEQGQSVTKVWVFRGNVVAQARKASGIEGKIHATGVKEKTRLDRRHHAIDAAVIAMMSNGVAQTLEIRNSLRQKQLYTGLKENEAEWKEYPPESSSRYGTFKYWKSHMGDLLKLLNDALDNDRISVTQSVRAALGNSIAHDATIHKLDKRPLGSQIDVKTIQKASTPALYVALTKLPDFDETDGLPNDPDRTIKVNGQIYNAQDKIGFFHSNAAQIAVQGGSADVGSAIHHARFYRCWQKGAKGNYKYFYGMVRVFQADLLRHRNSDLFTAPLPAHSLSMRYAEPKTAKAILDGNADFLGSLLVGDELELNLQGKQTDGELAVFCGFLNELSALPATYSRWTVDGFYSATIMRLRPRLLAREGLERLSTEIVKDIPEAVENILKRGWLPAVNKLSTFDPVTIRRNAFGEIRWASKAGLPISWSWS